MDPNDVSETEYTNLLGSFCNWSRPDNIAVEYHDGKSSRQFSYSHLNEAKRTVEKALNFLHVDEDYGFVGINADVEGFCIPALILGINESGNAFIPVSSGLNSSALGRLSVEYIFSSIPIVGTELVDRVIVLGRTLHLCKHDGRRRVKLVRNEFAYAITTSGSTGEASVVKVPHRCIVPNIIDFRRIYRIDRRDKIAQFTALTFDPSVVEIFLSLYGGSTLFVPSMELKNDPNRLLDSIVEHRITFLQITPSSWHQNWSTIRASNALLGKDSHLRWLLFGGEPPPKLEALTARKQRGNRTRIYNVYGITEVSCWASVNEIQFDRSDARLAEESNHLGESLSEIIFQVRDDKDNVVTDGEGVLYIGSTSRVCVVDEEKAIKANTMVFRRSGDVVSVRDESIRYLGRSDRNVKRYGNRLNLTKIETDASRVSLVKNCIALWEERSAKLSLCVLVETTNASVEVDSKLRSHFQSLPSFGRPDRIKYFDQFPLTEHGKVCTKTLAKSWDEKDREIDETTAKENTVRDTFTKICENWSIALNRGFTDAGGTSIAAMQISNELATTLNVEVPELIGMLLRNSSLDECFDYVVTRLNNDFVEESRSCKKVKLESTPVIRDLENDSNLGEKFPRRCWQKCRGNANGLPTDGDFIAVSSKIELDISHSYDLKKCVDASPTVFGYGDDETYATVGSHSGIVITTRINCANPTVYRIKLPDRIEASVLVTRNFNGIIGSYDGYVYSVHLKTGQIIWKFKTNDAIKCTAVAGYDKKSLIVGSYDRHLYCISIENGNEIWKLRASNGSISGTPRLCSESNAIFFGTLDGSCVSCDQSTGRIRWQNKLSNPIFSAPGILRTGNVVYCSVSGEMKCYDSTNGSEVWSYKIEGNVFSHLVITSYRLSDVDDIIVGCNDKRVYCISALPSSNAPVLRYFVTFDAPIFSTPYRQGNILAVADTLGNVTLCDVFDGRKLSSIKLNGDVFSSPVISADSVIVGCRDDRVYILKIINVPDS